MLSPALSYWLGLSLAVFAGAGVVFQGVVLFAFGRWFARPCPLAGGGEAVTLLKPLHGVEPRLVENLGSFLVQEHDGPVQMLCGVNDAGDAALPVARGLQAERVEVTVWPGPRAAGANGKIGNLVAMMRQARHPVLVLSDSDMSVGADYLAKVLGALAQPGVGVVSCLYIGRGDAGGWSELGAAAISYAMMPNMVLALRFGLSQPCMGSTIALRRETLDAIGGFERFVDVLADDYAIGAAVSELGLSVVVPAMLVTHACDEATLGALWRHHLRWMVTLRGIVGVAHWGTVVTHALPLALLTVPLLPGPGLVLTGLALGMRFMVFARVNRTAGGRSATFLQLVLADCIMFGVFLASLVARTIDWRGHRLTMVGNGRIRPHATTCPKSSI